MQNIPLNYLRKIAWSFQKTSGEEIEDLIQEAICLYLEAEKTYNPKKNNSKLAYSYFVVTNGLKNYIYKAAKENPIRKDAKVLQTDNTECVDDRKEYLQNMYSLQNNFWQLYDELTEDACLIVDKVLSQPQKYLEKPAKMTRGQILDELRAEGWKYQRIWNTMRELKALFN